MRRDSCTARTGVATGRLRLAVPALGALLLVACGGDVPPAPGPLPDPGLATEIVTLRTVPVERQLDGIVEAVDQATIAAQTAGRVAEILYDVNDAVPAGAVLVRLRSTEQRAGLAQAEAGLAAATAREAEAQSRYSRVRNMHERQVVPRAQLDQVAADRDSAVAELAAARAAVESAREGLAYTEVRAPYAGIVTARLVRVGETVGPGTPLMSGLSLGKLRVTVDIPQSLAAQVREFRKAAVYVNGTRLDAEGVTVFPEADSATNTFRTRVELPPGSTALSPGMFVKVAFRVGEAGRLLVPATAIVARSEVTALYVVGPDNRVGFRQVRTGQRVDDRVEVLTGLGAGERVALDPVAAARALTPARDD